jgi:hypothetical protein
MPRQQQQRPLNKRRPHLVWSATKQLWLCSLPASGHSWTIGRGITAIVAYERWYHLNQLKTIGSYYSALAWANLQAAGLTTIHHPIFTVYDTPRSYSNAESASGGNFFTAHQRQP